MIGDDDIYNPFKNRTNIVLCGFEEMIEKLTKLKDNYPPYNLVRNEDYWIIELALAGFVKDDLQIRFSGTQLIIIGKKNQDNRDYIYKGIAMRAFEKSFYFLNNVEIKDINLNNGLLSILITRQIKDEEFKTILLP